MTPQKSGSRGVRISSFIGLFVMAPVHSYPTRWRILSATDRNYNKGMLQPFRTFEAAMCKQAVISDVDAKQSEKPSGDYGHDHGSPIKEHWHQGEQRQHVIARDGERVKPIDAVRLHALR